MTSSVGKTAGLGIALLLAGNAFALGLGEVSGHATLGQPLRLEIPVFGSDGSVPAATCFRLRAPLAEIGNDFAVRNASVQVVSERGSIKLVVATTAVVREAVVGFAVAAGCGFELAKDYVLLVGLPSEPPPTPAPAPVAEAPATVTPPLARLADVPAPATPAENLLRIDAAVTLEALARQKYPLQPKAREKFMRMMRQANPGLTADDSSIAAGIELRIPPGLPQRRIGPYQGEAKPAPAEQSASKPQETPEQAGASPLAAPVQAAKPKAPTANPRKDRLVLGGAPEMSEAKLLAEAERLTTILVEQNKTQDAMTENLAKLEGSYAELQKNFAQLQDRLTRIEAERIAEKQAAKPLSVDFVELLLAVLVGGAIGGLALHLYQRLQARRNGAESASFVPVAPSAAKAGFKLPWARPAAPAAAVQAHETTTVANAATSAPILAATPLPTALNAALAAMAAPVIEPLVPEPPAPAPAATEPPAPESAVVESPAPAEDDLDSLSLDFPLMPAAKEEAPVAAAAEEPSPPLPEVAIPAAVESPVLDPLDFPLIAPTGNEESPALELPVVETAEANALPATAQEVSAPETLALDFPEILMASAPKQEDGHVIDFEPTPKDGQNALDFHKS